MKTDLTVGGYIFHDNKILLIHHGKLDLWLPVGGHIDENETPDQALLREIKEETGLEVEIVGKDDMPLSGNAKRILARPFHVNLHSVGDHDHCCFYYICKTLNPEELKINKELKGFEWFSEEDLNKDHIPADVRSHCLKVFEIMKANLPK